MWFITICAWTRGATSDGLARRTGNDWTVNSFVGWLVCGPS